MYNKIFVFEDEAQIETKTDRKPKKNKIGTLENIRGEHLFALQ